ncbi:receptor-type tyrosine-protein phosphatase F-like [Lytechinus pictus]|uniref:receptor-type tyrosine-protein phosphatase F-like n=1 Tax=Lytechinus pictus TaxID=7653 RepID=UPI0030BA081C
MIRIVLLSNPAGIQEVIVIVLRNNQIQRLATPVDPSGPPTNILSTGTRKRSITFTWDKPDCGYRNGPITSYDVILSNSTGGLVHQSNVSDSTRPQTTIDGLIPYSNYSIRIRAWNYELPGASYSPEFWARTEEAKPGPPIRVNLPASDQESITVEWMSPNPPLGRIIGYYVLYWETDDSSVTPIVRNVSFTCGDGQCSDINQRFSVIIPDLRPDTNYSVQASLILDFTFISQFVVEAETILGVGNPSPDQPLIRLTSEGTPSAIESVSYTSFTHSLRFEWDEPSCENLHDDLKEYQYDLYDTDRNMYIRYQISVRVNYVLIPGLDACTNYRFRVRVVTATNNKSRWLMKFAQTNVSGPASVESLQTSSSITQIVVSWELSSSSLCSPDSFIIRYSLYQKLACPSPDTTPTEYEVSTTSTRYTLVGLEPYSRYSIAVIAVNGVGQSEPMTETTDTGPGAPSAIESVSHTSSTHSLRFEWDELSCENLHDDLKEYQYDLYDTDRNMYIRYQISVRVNYVLIPGLDACTNYRFRVRVVTATYNKSRWLMKFAQTNVSEPGIPNIEQITKHQEVAGATGFTVTWDPPSSPPCEPTHYQIQYYIYQGDMCEDIPSQPQLGLTSAGSVNGSTFTFNILELRPNSEYMVFVRAKTSSGYGNSDSRKAVTGHSYPSGPPTNVHSTGTRKRSITFTWDKPDCGYRNGPITSYDVILSNSTGGLVHQSNVSDSTRPQTTIDGLIPYSNYSIRIRAWNYELPGASYSPEFWARTEEAKPGPPIRVNLPASDQESITVEWMSPNPPLGRIIGYYVLYWETDDSSVTPIVRNVSFTCGDGQCSDINQRFSVIIPDLRPDTNYSVQASLILDFTFISQFVVIS